MVSLRSLPKIACSSCELAPLGLGGDRLGLLLGELGEVGRRGHAGAQRRQAGRDADHLAPARAGRLVEGEGAGAADVPLAGTCGEAGHRLGDAVVAGQERRDVTRAGRRERQGAAAGADRREHVLHGRRAQQPHRLGRRLLDRLEERVAGAGVLRGAEPVGVLDHARSASARSQGTCAGRQHEIAHVVDVEHRGLGLHPGDVGVRAAHAEAARLALAAAGPALALQRRRERAGHVGPAGARRPGEQPRVGHAHPGGGVLEDLDGRTLADEVGPDGPGGWTGRGGHARSRRGATRCWIAAAISSIGARASSTT